MTRRRVFARLAPPVHVELSLSSSSSDDDDNDNDNDDGGEEEDVRGEERNIVALRSSRAAGRQVALVLPPTPPRRRPAESDVDDDQQQDVVLPGQRHSREARQTMPANAEQSAEPDSSEQVLQALQRFGQLRRQRFLHEQRLRMALSDGGRQGTTEESSDRGNNGSSGAGRHGGGDGGWPYVLGSASMSVQADWAHPRGTMTTPDVSAAGAASGELPNARAAAGHHVHRTNNSASASTPVAVSVSVPAPAAVLGESDLRTAFWQQFPSNDVDSYWYNQPEAESSGREPATPARMRETRAPVSLRRLGHLPSIARNPAAEESRRAMLEVIRMHGSTFSSNNSDDSDDDLPHGIDGTSSSARIRQRQHHPGTHPYVPMRMQHPSWLAAQVEMHGRLEKPEPVDPVPADSQRAQKIKARADEQLLRWLIKHTVPARPLDCSLLQPGIEFFGEQSIGSSGLSGNLYMQMQRQRLGTEKWDVHVVIQSVDMERGRVAGMMRAINVPRMPRTVVTHWEGEVVDFVNYSPLTVKWQAGCKEDTEHWSLFDPVKSQPQT
ncbi:hypothetical protein LPJ56_004622 [Coemansia sp. RSA 2599]|nr:hypothetical protein LPJ56_004622 [Coemansia sp. RSA 2599]